MGEILHGLDALKAWKEKNDSKEGNQKDTQEKSPAPEKPAFDAKLATAPYNFIPLPTGVLPSPLDKYRDVFMGDSQERTQEAFAEYMAHTETRDGYIELTIRTMTPVFIGGDVKSFAPTGEPIIPGSTLRGMTKNLVKIVTLGAMRAEEDFHDRHLYFRCIMTTGKSEPWENLKLSVPSNESRMLDSVISAMAAHRRFDTDSPKMNRAISVVAAISKFPSNEAWEDDPYRMPSIRRTGAAMSSAIMPMTYGRSFRLSFSLPRLFRARDMIPMPVPAPR